MLAPSPPQKGEPMADILANVDRVIMPGMTHWNHPRFFAYFTSSGSGPGILGDLLATAFNINGMVWQSCPAVSRVEVVVRDEVFRRRRHRRPHSRALSARAFVC
jgi:aromatic-L-amino-acid decarboxylase